MATVLAEAIEAAAAAGVAGWIGWRLRPSEWRRERRVAESWRPRDRQLEAWGREFKNNYRARQLLTTPPETWVKEAEAKFDSDREYRARMSRVKRR